MGFPSLQKGKAASSFSQAALNRVSTCGHVHNTTYPRIEASNFLGGLSSRLKFLRCSPIDNPMSESGPLRKHNRRDFRALCCQTLGSFSANTASGRDGVQNHVGGFLCEMAEGKSRLDCLEVEGGCPAGDQHHVSRLRRTKGRLIGVRRGVYNEKIGPVRPRRLNQNGKTRGLAAHDLRRVGLPSVAPTLRRG